MFKNFTDFRKWLVANFKNELQDLSVWNFITELEYNGAMLEPIHNLYNILKNEEDEVMAHIVADQYIRFDIM